LLGRHRQLAPEEYLDPGTTVVSYQHRVVVFQTYLVSLDLKLQTFLKSVLLLTSSAAERPMSHVHGMAKLSQLISHHLQLLSSLVDPRQPGRLQISPA
jgi:hypothetical protein